LQTKIKLEDMAFKMRSPLHARTEPVKQGYGKVVEETGATKQTLKPKDFSTRKDIGAGGVRVLKARQKELEQSKASKTPTIDKFMKMNERPSASPSEPSYLDKVKKKAGMVADVVGKATGVSNIPKLAEVAGSFVSPMFSPKSEPKSIIEGPSKRDEQEQKRKEEKAIESYGARYELPAPGSMSSPMYLDAKSYGVGTDDDTKASKKDEEIDEETGDIVEDAGETTADKYQKMMDETEESYGDNPFLRGRIDVARNKAQKARLQGRLDRRLERQEERAKRSNLRNYGNVEGVKQQDVQNKNTKEESTANNTSSMGPQENYIDQPTYIETLRNNVKDSSTAMTPNRAGRPINSNMLMTTPVIKTGKHSAKEAVAKLRMRNIAQSE